MITYRELHTSLLAEQSLVLFILKAQGAPHGIMQAERRLLADILELSPDELCEGCSMCTSTEEEEPLFI